MTQFPINPTIRKRVYNLEERTRFFGKNVIYLCKKVRRDCITTPIITQLVKSSTSVGANYCEADNAESRQDFIHKLAIAKKESKETVHFLEMLLAADEKIDSEVTTLINEAKELTLILNSIYIKVKNKKPLGQLG